MTQKHHKIEDKSVSRAKYNCSAELSELIRKANLVKVDYRNWLEEYKKRQLDADPRFGNLWFSVAIAWYEFVENVPDELKSEIRDCNEYLDFEKEDSLEFWINRDGYAQDKIIDMNADGIITDAEFELIINSGADEIAEFLVEYGYYGDEYSYQDYLKKEANEEYNKFDEYDDMKQRTDNDFIRISPNLRALYKLYDIREFLLAIANLSNNFQQNKAINDGEVSFYQTRMRKKIGEKAFQDQSTKKLKEKIFATSFSINEKGEISFSISDWANILQGVDITRIRLCEVCQNIFWAKRKDAFACSPKHSKRRQMRNLRENWKKSGKLYLKARKDKSKKKTDD